MPVATSKLIQNIEHTLDSELSGEIEATDIINEAGEYLVSMHPWKWLERPALTLSGRPNITLNAAAYSNPTLTVSGYSFEAGDTVTVTGGTGSVTEGTYVVKSGTPTTAVLETDPGGTALTGTLNADGIVLPSDVMEIIAIDAREGLVNNIQLTSFAQLLYFRTNTIDVSNFQWFAALTHAVTSADDDPVKRLEVWPPFSADNDNVFSLVYRAGWHTVASEDEKTQTPDYVDTLLIQLVRAFARGYMEEDEASLALRLMDIEQSPYLRHAIRRDGMVQSNMGPLTGGAVSTGFTLFDWGHNTTVGEPL